MDSNDKLLAFIEDEERQADLQNIEIERKTALQYYQPNSPLGNEIEGRSQVVLRDTFDTVEWMMPSLLKVFVGGDEVVKFEPRGPEDVDAAEQESEYVNYLVMQRNEGFLVFHDWIKDVLLLKNGYVKVSVENEAGEATETYKGLSEDELTMLAQQPDIEIVASENYPCAQGIEYNIQLRKKGNYPCVKIENLRPETVKVSSTHRGVSVMDSPFVEHWEMKSLSELREMGLDVDDDIADESGMSFDNADLERRAHDNFNLDREESLDPASRRVRTREVWCRYDSNEDGIAELQHLIVVGTDILLQEPAEVIPIASLVAIRVPHKHSGISIADLVKEIQDIRTTLLRNGLDQQYLRNHGRHAIDVTRVNLEDMLVSRPGGIVRVQGDPGGAIMPLVNPQGGSEAVQMIEYMDTVRENRTGITKYNQGMDSRSLNKTATGVNAIQNAAQQRIELIARFFAETGVKELFTLVHRFSWQYARKSEVVRLRNKWVTVDPREWKERKDMTISVGLGMGNKDQQAQQITMMLQFMQQGMQIGIVNPQNMYHAAEKYINLMGFKDTQNWLTDPSQQPPQPPQPDPVAQKLQQEGQMKQAQMQQDGQMKQAQMQADMQMAQQKAQMDAQIAMQSAQAQMELSKQVAMMEAQSAKEVAMIKAQADIEIAQYKAQASAQAQMLVAQAKAESMGEQPEPIGNNGQEPADD